MKKYSIKKIGGIILVLALLIGMLPTVALAAEQATEADSFTSSDIFNELTPKHTGSLIDKSNLNISDFDKAEELKLPSQEISPAAAPTAGFYVALSDYLTAEGQNKFVHPIIVEPGEVLQIQLDCPNSAAIDYDMYLFEADPSTGNLTRVDASEFTTYINGSFGTLPEAVGVVNMSSATKQYAVFFKSYKGFSTSMPFTAHIGVNACTDAYEADENPLRSH